MELTYEQAKNEDVSTLITRKQYGKAIDVIKVLLQAGPPDPHLRLQLADALVFAEREREAVMVLLTLADEYARDGFSAKAISVLKKIQKIDPGRRDIETKLAALIETKQRMAGTQPYTPQPASSEIGMEEIGFDPLPGGPIAVPASPSAPKEQAPFVGSAPEPPPLAPPPPQHRAPVADFDLLADSDNLALEPLGDGDLLELEPLPESELPAAKPAVDAAFTSELLSIIDGLFPSGVTTEWPAPAKEPVSGRQIVVSPLFKDFSVDEMVAVIQGIRLLTVPPRKVILRQGDPGQSLYILTAGRVRAFVKSPEGKQLPLADLEEGAFFGEMSILTGRPRNATIVAITGCDLLELDRATLDGIIAKHPRVQDVMREFAQQRSRARPSLSHSD